MRDTLYFPSYAEFIQRTESLKNRQERLIQVRQHEKKKASQFLDRMRTRAQEEYENTEKYIMNEICELHSKELACMRQVYEECIAKINEDHYSKAVQPKSVQNRTSSRALTDKNVLRKKSPVKTIVICEDSQKPSAINAKGGQVRVHENIDRTESKRSVSPTKRITRNENQNKVEVRTTSIYHEKCVPSSQRSSSPKKKSVSVKGIQTTPTVTVTDDPMNKKMFSVKSIQTTPNLIIVEENGINKVTNPSLNVFLKKSTEDFLNSYTQRVHDRIRILEQKERMLQRRAVFLPEYNRHAIIPSVKNRVAEPDDEVTRDETEPTKPKKFPAAKTGAGIDVEKTESSKISVTALPSKSVATNTEVNVGLTPKKTCHTAIQTSGSCKKKNRRCKRANLAKNEDMIIFIRNQNEISNTIDSEIPSKVFEQISSNTSRENESSVSETEKISLTVRKFAQNTANQGEKRSKSRKLDNWRRLFINSEKLSDSSYYSPPDPSRAGQKLVTSKKKKCRRHLIPKNDIDECNTDMGYYVAKLLLMSPESVENLNVVSEETIPSICADEIAEKPELNHSNNDDSIDEEEFLRRMLEVKFPDPQTAIKKTPPRKTSPPRAHISLDSSTTVVETDVKSRTSSMTISENSKISSKDNGDSGLKDTSKTNLKLDSKLSGWIEASIRRTLEASAVNSTSSYDECDSVRQVDQLVLSMIEKCEYFLSSEKSSSPSTRFSFSPVAVPNVRLNVPRLPETST